MITSQSPQRPGAVVATAPEAVAVDVVAPTQRARRAQREWARATAVEWAAVLSAVADAVAGARAELAELAIQEAGKPCRGPSSVEARFSRLGEQPGVVVGFVLDRRDHADLVVQAAVVVPADVLRDGDLEIVADTASAALRQEIAGFGNRLRLQPARSVRVVDGSGQAVRATVIAGGRIALEEGS